MPKSRAISALESLARSVPGITTHRLGEDRVAVEISISSNQFDFDKLRQHPLLKQNGTEKVPGVSSTICFDECHDRVHLTTYYPDDLEALLRAVYCGEELAPA